MYMSVRLQAVAAASGLVPLCVDQGWGVGGGHAGSGLNSIPTISGLCGLWRRSSAPLSLLKEGRGVQEGTLGLGSDATLLLARRAASGKSLLHSGPQFSSLCKMGITATTSLECCFSDPEVVWGLVRWLSGR